MSITDSFKKAVSAGDVKGIRIMMKNSLLVDPTFAEFDEMSRLSQAVSGLYDSHDGRDFALQKKDWNDEYMDKLMVQVVGNFSHERLEHLKEVVRHLRPVKSQPEAAQGAASANTSGGRSKSYQEQKREDQKNGHFRRQKIGTGAVVGAVAGGVVAGVAVGTNAIIAGVVVGAAVGGAVVAIATGGER